MASVQYSSIISDNYLHQQHQISDNFIKPTIFDILAQENLLDLFHSSFNHVFRWLANYNQTISRLESYNNEIYLILHSSIEYLYLKCQELIIFFRYLSLDHFVYQPLLKFILYLHLY